MVGAIRYRVGQFFRALRSELPADEVQSAIQALGPQGRALFLRQEAQDQRHAVAVYSALRDEGYSHPDLLAAALLHDVGKSAAPCPPSVRAMAVLMGYVSPGVLARLTRGSPQESDSGAAWRRALAAHVHHAEQGALWAEEAGCSPVTVALIRRHREQVDAAAPGAASSANSENELLIALLRADAVN